MAASCAATASEMQSVLLPLPPFWVTNVIAFMPAAPVCRPRGGSGILGGAASLARPSCDPRMLRSAESAEYG